MRTYCRMAHTLGLQDDRVHSHNSQGGFIFFTYTPFLFYNQNITGSVGRVPTKENRPQLNGHGS